MRLSEMANGSQGCVVSVVAASAEVGPGVLRRLEEIGFIPGEPVRVLRRGPGGREPLAVQVGETIFALRLREAECINIQLQAAQERAA